MHRRGNSRIGLVIGAAAVATQAGCAFGPTALTTNRGRYNEAIQRTSNEQLLRNLVRLRYRDVPFLLEVGSVSAQFEIRESAGFSGTLTENVGPNPINPDVLGLDGAVVYTERPTVTFTPVQGQDFVQRLMTPLGLDTIVLLQRSGWSIERVLRLTVQHMNGLDNAARASGPTPVDVPDFKEFAKAAELLRDLHRDGRLTMGYVTTEVDLSDPAPVASVDGEAILQAAREGMRFRLTEDGRSYVLHGPRRQVELQFAPSVTDAAETHELRRLLRLTPGTDRYVMEQIGTDLTGRDADAAPQSGIQLGTRSLLGIMFYLSLGVRTPPSHERDGLVTVVRDESGRSFDWTRVTGDLLRVHCRRTPPLGAYVAVRHRGYWFYVDDADLESKSTFSLLAQLVALQAGVGEAVVPLLTLPVGG